MAGWKPALRMEAIGVVHVVDALAMGGAERVAVNLANLLPRERYAAHLATTRAEGPLSEMVAPHVVRLSLERRGRIDTGAVRRFARFLKERSVRIVHAHASALFFARLGTALGRESALIWHDHYGRADFGDRPAWLYRLATRGAAGVIAVNETLAAWCRERLRLPEERVWYVPNFVAEAEPAGTSEEPALPGEPGKRMVCVANFRPQKDHPNLLRAMSVVARQAPGAHLLLVGEPGDGTYTEALRAQITELGLEGAVTWLGPRKDVAAILRACDIGVLSSASEGLPLALLEYGRAGLAAVATGAGQCPEVLDHGRAGMLVPPREPEALGRAMVQLLSDGRQRMELGARFHLRVEEHYSPDRIVGQVCEIYESVLRGN
ncbi:MAG TPA: glycosyltransferase [Bryobacteraceae bacterium]|nr:glycosyltransferase [Bryobacteraceae bacterium]